MIKMVKGYSPPPQDAEMDYAGYGHAFAGFGRVSNSVALMNAVPPLNGFAGLGGCDGYGRCHGYGEVESSGFKNVMILLAVGVAYGWLNKKIPEKGVRTTLAGYRRRRRR